MNEIDYATAIRSFVVENFLFGDDRGLQDDVSFLTSGIVDSTGMNELILFLEENYGIKVEPEEMVPENLDGVSRAAQFVSRKVFKPAVA